MHEIEGNTPAPPAAGFSRIPHALIDSGQLNGLRPSSLRVLIQLNRMAGREGCCWPSQRTLAARTGLKVGAVRNAIRQLLTTGLVVRERCGRVGRSALYRVMINTPHGSG